MAIERTDIETANAEELEKLRQQARDAELARVRAEAALEESRRAKETPTPVAAQQAAWTEEQWAQAEQQTGMSRQALIASAQIADERAAAKTRAIEDRLKAAEEKAARAEERANRFEQSRGFESQVNKYIDSKPALRAYKDDMDAFLNKFPESDRKDPEKLKSLLSDAEIYVRGKVGAKMRSTGGGSSAKLGSDNFDETGDSPSLDLSDLDNKHQRRVVEDIFEEVKGKDSKDLEKMLSSDKTTVRIDSASEWENYGKK